MSSEQVAVRPSGQETTDLPENRACRAGRGGVLAGAMIAVLFAVGVALRVIASKDNFWLDEIWSWTSLRSLSSLRQALTGIQSDNYLVSLLMFFIGPHAYWTTYRLPSIVAGILSVIYAGLTAREHGPWATVVTVGLVSGSHLLVHYSSEARGYSLCVFFAIFSYYHLRRYFAEQRRINLVLFQIGCVFGLLSHLQFVGFLFACAVWIIYRNMRAGKRALPASMTAVMLLAAPLLVLGVLSTVNLSAQHLGSGDPTDPLLTIRLALSLAVGGRLQDDPQVWATLAAIILIVAALAVVAKRNEEDAVFYAAAILIAPLLQMYFMQGERMLLVRYFMVPIAFSYLLMGRAAGHLAGQGRGYAVLTAILLTAFLAGNGANIHRLLKYGRGNYLAALTYMIQTSPQRVVTVSSDQDFRNKMTIDFYRPYLPPGRTLQYIPSDEVKTHPPEWMILSTHQILGSSPPTFNTSDMKGYRLVREYRHAGLSGFRWGIYRRSGS